MKMLIMTTRGCSMGRGQLREVPLLTRMGFVDPEALKGVHA